MTEKLYVLGHPVGHSKSPVMHNAAFKALGVQWEYGFKDCEARADAQAFLDGRAWRACNVTTPWKRLAYESADSRTLDADLVQGANTLVYWGGQVHADNTDGRGCVAYLSRCGVRFEGARIAVCGTGPTSLAIAHACARAGAGNVTLLGRDDERAHAVVAAYLERLGEGSEASPVQAGSYASSGDGAIAAADVVVDATPLGMRPGDPAPFDTALLSAGQVVFDAVYGHGETALIAAARSAGCDAHDGAGMLVAQAVEAQRFFAATTGAYAVPAHLDLFAIMSDAAGF